jgi:hypothetical protein
VADRGGGDPGIHNADLDALPPELSEQSLSRALIILPLDGAIAAIAHLTDRGRRLENWEGWVRIRGGGRAKSLAHSGSFALPRDARRAAETAVAAMRKAKAAWDRSPEYPGGDLYFGLTFGAAT